MASFKVLGGDFKANDSSLHRGTLLLYDPRRNSFLADTEIPASQIASVEVVTEENVKRAGGTVGWAAAGGLLLGPLGLLGGALLGGRGKDITFLCTLRDGRRFLANASSEAYKEFLAESMKSLAPGLMGARSEGMTLSEPGQLEAWSFPRSAADTLLAQLFTSAGIPKGAPKRALGAGRDAATTTVKPAMAVRRIHTVIAAFCDG